MKKIAFIILGLSMTLLINYGYAQKPYYYYFDKVIELTENPTIRYIDFIDETTAERDSILRDRIRKFATEIPYGNNKYMYVTKDTAMMDSGLEDHWRISGYHFVKFHAISVGLANNTCSTADGFCQDEKR